MLGSGSMVSAFVFAALLLFLGGVAGCASWSAEKSAPMIGQTIDVDGVSIHVVEAGPANSDLPPVVLIHGASVNLRDMKMSLGDPLARDRRVVLIDRPGRGYSERPKNGHELAVQARLIHGAMEALEVERPIVVGQSLGGAVALNYALQFQSEMTGLVLLAPVSHEWPGGVAWYNNASQIPLIGMLLRRLVIPIYGQLSAKGGIEESFAPNDAPEDYYERSGLALLFRAKDFKSNASDVANLKDEIIAQQPRYGELRLPVAIVTGTSDSTVSPEIHSKQLAQEVDHASLLLLPNTGHALHHAETAAILDVINEISAGRALTEE